MSAVDVLVIGVLAIGLVLGMMRGFLSQFTGIAGLLAGLWLAGRWHIKLREVTIDRMTDTGHNGLIAFIAITVATVVVAGVCGWSVRKAIDKLELGAYDRLMGAAFGTVKAGLICGAILLSVVYASDNGGVVEKHISESRTGPLLWRGMSGVAGALPERYRGDVQGFLNEHRLPETTVSSRDTGRMPNAE